MKSACTEGQCHCHYRLASLLSPAKMLRTLHTRRHPRYGAQVCAVLAAILLLVSVSVLHSRLGIDRHSHRRPKLGQGLQILSQKNHGDQFSTSADDLLEDADPDFGLAKGTEDRIDELDVVEEDNDPFKIRDDEAEEEDDQSSVSGLYYDHYPGVFRRSFDKNLIGRRVKGGFQGFGAARAAWAAEEKSKTAFDSDDLPVDEKVRSLLDEIKTSDDLLLLKTSEEDSVLRHGWGEWFEKKNNFLKKNRMYKTSFERLNPSNNPLLKDPDTDGVITQGDRLVQLSWIKEMKKVPFPYLGKKPLESTDMTEYNPEEARTVESDFDGGRKEIQKEEPRTLDGNAIEDSYSKGIVGAYDEVLNSRNNGSISNNSKRNEPLEQKPDASIIKVADSYVGKSGSLKDVDSKSQVKLNLHGGVYADGKRWGYFPGLNPYLSFSNFMEAFFHREKCHFRVFMVWNSPPWMYSVRHQRGLESLLLQHPDACVVVFSETIELDFFKHFLKDGYKVATAMPNLDELLKDTPTHIFSSVWFEWRKTKFYSTHYSELVRLAALYKYGGLYIDSDIIVVRPLYSLNNSVGMENPGSMEGQFPRGSLNGAVMAFRKNSPFIMECLSEFYLTYDDSRFRWNGADLLTRVAKNFSKNRESFPDRLLELKLHPPFAFFPISAHNITRYFTAPLKEAERAQQDMMLKQILNESLTFHFWNSLTYSFVPERDSLVARIINNRCIRCSDML